MAEVNFAEYEAVVFRGGDGHPTGRAYVTQEQYCALLDAYEKQAEVAARSVPWLVWGPDSSGPQWELNALLAELSCAPV